MIDDRIVSNKNVLAAECDRSSAAPANVIAKPIQIKSVAMIRRFFVFFRLVRFRVFAIDRLYHIKALKSMFKVGKRTSRLYRRAKNDDYTKTMNPSIYNF